MPNPDPNMDRLRRLSVRTEPLAAGCVLNIVSRPSVLLWVDYLCGISRFMIDAEVLLFLFVSMCVLSRVSVRWLSSMRSLFYVAELPS